MPASSLSALALSEVSRQLEEYGSSLRGKHRDAIEALLEALEAGLTGTLTPHYHLSAIDPGIGKSLSVATFLRVWKDEGFHPDASVLIGLSRLTEIDSYIKAAGLHRDDVAVLTSDVERNDLGVPKDRHGQARIMFTTQQMIVRRTRGKEFAKAEEFHFRGRPRQLRIWDESLLPAERIALSVDDIARLPSVLAGKSTELVDVLRKLTIQLWAAEEGVRVPIPEDLDAAPNIIRSIKDQEARAAIEDLTRLAGQEVDVVSDHRDGLLVVGASSSLPADFMPVVILDASGRVRSTYRVWEEAGGPLRHLPTAVNDYGRLHVNLWERAVGKEALRKPGTIEDTAKAVAEVIDADPASNWLVVCYKDQPIEGLVKNALAVDHGDRLQFLTWGRHLGTNEFKHCEKIVLIGQLTYADAGYRALAAACGASLADPLAAEKDLKDGEYRHNLLQALTRARVRQSVNGIAGACTAYVIASPGLGFADMIEEVFPGCLVQRWSPIDPGTKSLASQLIALLQDALAEGNDKVSKKAIREVLGLLPSNLSPLFRDGDVRRWMESHKMRINRFDVTLRPQFEPYEDGGFVWEDLDDVD